MKEQIVGKIEQLTDSMDALYNRRAETLYKEIEKYIKKSKDKEKIISIIEKWMW